MIIHASCVTLNGRGLVILGGSGAGKSGLALQLLAFGAQLVADDQTIVTSKDDVLYASSPQPICGMIEARGVGLLTATMVDETRLDLAVDLDQTEQQRLPEMHFIHLDGLKLTCFHKVDSPYFPAAILQYLRSGRRNP